MPSALETLVKILKLEKDTSYQNTAVIGGLKSYADNWLHDAHQQAKIPEHHALVDELVAAMHHYDQLNDTTGRHDAINYMLGRIMGRITAPDAAFLPESYTPPPLTESPSDSAPAVPDEETLQPTNDEADEIAASLPDDTPPSEPDNMTESDELTDSAIPPATADASIQRQPPTDPMPNADDDARPAATAPADEAPPARRSWSQRRNRENLSIGEARRRFEDLQQPVTTLHRVGAKMAEKLNRLGIDTLEDMLLGYPRRYDDYTRMRTLNQLQPGEVVTVIAMVNNIVRKKSRGGTPYLLMTVDDDTSAMQVVFFGQMWLQRQFKRGSQVVLSGKVDLFRGTLTMTNPEWEMLEREHIHTHGIVPVYPLTKGLSARTMRRLKRQAVNEWSQRVPDYLPESVLERTDLPDLVWALQQIHFPDGFDDLEEARTRLAFNELFVFQMALLGQRQEWQSQPGTPLAVSDDWLEAFLSTLPYTLTGAQQRALNSVRDDVAQAVPMNRLLQGDVGSGKTVVAAAALAMAVANGKQAALMAPTSILAEQHARSIGALLEQAAGDAPLNLRLLTGNTSEVERQEIYAGLADGSIHIVIGTHALIQQTVTFHDLALAIIDEQHRFGVQQRGSLRGKGHNPHILVMTATPIPRTLALTLYADLDLSVIDEMPPGRTPIQTRILSTLERERAYSFIRSQVGQGRQAFIVYPLVEASDKLEDVGAAADEFDRLQTRVFTNERLGLLHGRLGSSEKEAVMNAFAAGEIDILVSTAVVEVGIDVPNVSVMLIENASRFGLAQLHQFRGRVGRGAHASYCLLMADRDVPEGNQRLQAMEDTTDGFKLAEIDWQLRGAGDLLGLQQSGVSQFRLAELMNPRMVELAQREARTVYAEDPLLEQPEHQYLADRIQMLFTTKGDVS